LKVINLHQEETEMIRLAINNRQAQQAIYNQFSLGVCGWHYHDNRLCESFTNLSQFQFCFEG
jgi:RNA polymerase sigma-70 factor (ECF subfamily)